MTLSNQTAKMVEAYNNRMADLRHYCPSMSRRQKQQLCMESALNVFNQHNPKEKTNAI